MRFRLATIFFVLCLNRVSAENLSRGWSRFDLAAKAGSISRISLTKASRLNNYFSITYPAYDVSWSNQIYSDAEFKNISLNGLLMIPSILYEMRAKSTGVYDESKGWLLLLAFTAVPIAIPNLKLRFDRFGSVYVEAGFESEAFFPEEESGWSVAGTVGMGLRFRDIILGINLNQTLFKDTSIPFQSIWTVKIGLAF